jgi:hypothetical protein
MVRRILKWLGIAIAGLVFVILGLFAVAWIVNLHDEPMTPQAQALLKAPPNPYAADDNLYLALAGTDAPSGQSVIADSQARVDWYNQRLDSVLRNPTLANMQSLTPEDPKRLSFKGDCAFVSPLESSVWSVAPQHREEIRKLMADNSELYQRYLESQRLSGYYETARPSFLTPIFAWPGTVHKLFLADLVLRLRSPGPPAHLRQAFTDLKNDVQMWRRVFGGQGGMVSKMVSVAYLQGDNLLIADMIADPQFSLPTGEDADALVAAPDLKDWSVGNGLAYQFRDMSSILRQTDDLSSRGYIYESQARSGVAGWLNRVLSRGGGHFFKINATENQFARLTVRRALEAADPASFFRERKEETRVPPEDFNPWTVRLSYNPLGKILVAIEGSYPDIYILRAWDGAALQRLVRLGYEIRRQRIDAAAVPAFLQHHPEWSTHPADRRPFVWDSQRAEIQVQTLAKQPPGRRFSIRVWQPALAASAAPR